MKVLITGANGFIGSYLAEALIDEGYDVKCLVRKTSNLQWLLPYQNTNKRNKISFIYGDITDKASLYNAVKDIDYVYHLAGLIKTHHPEDYYEVNYLGTKNLIETVKEVSPKLKKFIFLSSLAASGPSADGHLLRESDECHPITDYGKSKLRAEELLKNKFMRDIPIVIIRPPVIYGPRDRGFYFYFKVVKKRFIPVLRNKLSFCFVSDLVNGIILTSESEKACGQIYFISSDKTYSSEQIGKLISDNLGIRAVKIKIPKWLILTAGLVSESVAGFIRKTSIFNRQKARELIQSYWICDVSKAKRELGFNPGVGIEEGIRTTVDWYIKHGWL